jgi:RNA polymerase sigma-70 factor (ECF subfamily)
VNGDPDAPLMRAFQAGDLGAFEVLFQKFKGPLMNFAARFLRDRGRAEDVVQETLLRVYLARAEWKPDARLGTWIYRIATNLCLNELRQGRRRPAASLEGPATAEPVDRDRPAPDAVLAQRRFERAFEAALELLPERQRAAFLLHRFEAMSYREIGAALETSESSVKALIHRATLQLRQALWPFLEE